jgi:hypothetical protein
MKQKKSGKTDVFAEVRERYTIGELWGILRLPGEPPRPGKKFPSPFRPDRHPSCDVSKCGRWFADRSRGLNLNVVEFAKHALDCDWREARLFFKERLGIDEPPTGKETPIPATSAPAEIQWPGELETGDERTWQAFARKQRLTCSAVQDAVELGVLRFLKIGDIRCFAVTDKTERAAEIRRCDGRVFPNGSKQYPLRGVDKKWLPGAERLTGTRSQAASVFICEGPTCFLAAWSAYDTYRRNGGPRRWIPLALLGAGCRKPHPELIPWFRGRTVRIAPDGDDAGEAMGVAWRDSLLRLGCAVEIVNMPPGQDLRDLLVSGELQPEGLFQ